MPSEREDELRPSLSFLGNFAVSISFASSSGPLLSGSITLRRHGRLFPCPFLPLMFHLLTSCATIIPTISTVCFFFSGTPGFVASEFSSTSNSHHRSYNHTLSPTHHHRRHQLCLRFQVIHRPQRPAINRRAPSSRHGTTQAAAENPHVRATSGRPHFEDKQAAVTRQSFNVASASIHATQLRDGFCACFVSTGAIRLLDGLCVYLISYHRHSTSVHPPPSNLGQVRPPMARPVLIRRFSQQYPQTEKKLGRGMGV